MSTRQLTSRAHQHPRLSPEAWDAFVVASGAGFLQSWEWGEFQEAVGSPVVRHVLSRPGETKPLAAMQAFVHALPLGQSYAYVPRGPAISASAQREDILAAMAEAAEIAREEGAAFVRADFPFRLGEIPLAPEAMRKAGYRHAKSSQPNDTVIMDLAKDEATLLSEMHQKTRYNVRLAEKHGVTVFDGASRYDAGEEASAFWRLLDETAARDKFHTHPRAYYERMLAALGREAGKRLKARVMFAEYRGEPVAAVLLAEFGDTVTYLHGASAAAHRNVMAPYLLHWRAIVDARARGFTKYDFWGVAPTDDPDHAWAGITRFKKGFGGERVSYIGAWELPTKPLWYTLYRCARKLRG